MTLHQILQPEGWAPAKGYANGMAAEGKQIFLAGQIGWNAQQQFESDDFVVQLETTLRNIVALLQAAGAGPEHLVRLTWFITDKKEYVTRLREVGQAYRAVLGRNFPAMSVVAVTALMEDRAKIEIEATAVIPS